MEECGICGRDACIKFVQASVRGDVFEIPVCGNCYQIYEPRPSRRGVEFKEARRVSHIGYILWFIESSTVAKIIERLGRTYIGRVVASLSVVSIPLVFLSIALIIVGGIDRILRPDVYLHYAESMPRGFMTTGIPGLDPAIPFIYGWIAISILVTIHEFAHGIASTHLGTPPRRAGVALLLGMPVAGYVKIDMNPFGRSAWRFVGAGNAVNFLTAMLSLMLLILQGAPEPYIKHPSLLLLPPEYVKHVLGIDVSMSFVQSLLAYIWLINLWGAVFNSLPIPGLDGCWIYASMLSRATSRLVGDGLGWRLGVELPLTSGFTIVMTIAVILLVERVIIPYL